MYCVVACVHGCWWAVGVVVVVIGPYGVVMFLFQGKVSLRANQDDSFQECSVFFDLSVTTHDPGFIRTFTDAILSC